MNKSALKFYLIPAVVAIVIIVILLLVPLKKENTIINGSPTPTIIINLPTKILSPDSAVSPTLIPPAPFTGADINQELPPDLKAIGEQKTALRRLLPLTLPFATIEFDYENDIFIVHITDGSEQNRQSFTQWREQNYPALTQDKFAIR